MAPACPTHTDTHICQPPARAMLPRAAARAAKRPRRTVATAVDHAHREALVRKTGGGGGPTATLRRLAFFAPTPPPPPLSLPQRDALDAAAYARASADAAYLERDPADRPPPSSFLAFYEAAALRSLEAALAAVPAAASADPLTADAMLARDRLAASVRRGGGGEEAWPE